MKKEKEIRVLIVEPDKKPYQKTIKNELKTFQSIVGGYIEVMAIEQGVSIICNEEGKINQMELNRPLYDSKGKLFDIIAGTFIVAGDDIASGEFVSLSDSEVEEYKRCFHTPVYYVKLNDEIIPVPRPDGGR